MPAASYIQTNFTAGEQSPRLRARVDISKYANGAKTLENFIVMAHGGIQKRPGTHYTGESRDSTKVSRLIPFEFSTTQAYALEFGDKSIRFFKDSAQIELSLGMSAATLANPCVIGVNYAHQLRDGEEVTITGVSGMTELNGNTYTATWIDDFTFSIGIDSSGFTAYTFGGTATYPYSIETPWLEAEIFDLQIAQSADVMWICHKNVKTQKLSRTGHTSWSLDTYAPTTDPFVPATSATITGATKAAECVITTSAAHNFTTGDRVSIDGIVGITKLNGKTFIITVLTTTTFSVDFADTSVGAAYSSGGTAHTSVVDNPGSVTFFEQRLWFAATSDDPQKIWSTLSGDYNDMTIGTADDDALSYTIASGKVNTIQWLTGLNDLLIGTAGAQYRATGGNNPVTPTNISIKRQTGQKSARIEPVAIDNNALFVQGSGKKVRELTFDFNSDGYISSDLTILSEHITGTGVVEIDYKDEPDPIIYAIRDDGQLIGLTYEKAQEVVGWHRHITNGTFESLCVIPNGDHDQLWVLVKRNIDGNDVRYIEYFDAADWVDMEDIFYLDCGLTYDGSAVTTISGLDHLEGETVQVVTDGAEHPDRTVVSGSITLQEEASVVHVGLKYTATFENLEPEGANPAGTAQGKKKSWSRLILRVYQTMGGSVDGKLIPYKTTSDLMDSPPPLFTGDIKATHQGSESDALITITHDTPFPMTLLAYMANLKVSNG